MSVGESADARAFWTPLMIAQRWGATAEMVRACIRSGQLAAFGIGPRLYRISAERLAEFEAQRTAEAAKPKRPPPLTPEEREAKRLSDRERDFRIRLIRVGAKRRREFEERAEAKRKEADFVAELIESVLRGGRD